MSEFTFRDDQGYIWVKAPPGHPYSGKKSCVQGKSYGNGYVKRSRLIVESIVGRYLTPKEVVHHINGVKDDDRSENLKLMSMSEHSRLHFHEKVPRRRIGAPHGKVACVYCSKQSHIEVKRGLCCACYNRAKRLKHKTGAWPSWACLFPTRREANGLCEYDEDNSGF